MQKNSFYAKTQLQVSNKHEKTEKSGNLLLISAKKNCAFFIRIALTCLAFSSLAHAQQSELPWLENIGAKGKRGSIHTISADAMVTVSDGTSFRTNSLFHDRQRAIHRQVKSGRIVTMGVEGKYFWIYDGSVEKEAPAFVENLVLGHQMHAQLLFFDHLFQPTADPETALFNGRECLVLRSESENSPWAMYYTETGTPLGMELNRKEEPNITYEYGDWRSVDGIMLPFTVLIDDGSNEFQYKYTAIKFNQGNISNYRAPENVLTDEQKLLRLHRIFMDGHLFGGMAEMKAVHGDSIVIVGRGEVNRMTGAESSAILEQILTRSNYAVYDDLIRPIVSISQDGTLGWVIAQIKAKGVDAGDTGKPFQFICAWIELYEKVHGNWQFTGNVSNFQPAQR